MDLLSALISFNISYKNCITNTFCIFSDAVKMAENWLTVKVVIPGTGKEDDKQSLGKSGKL